MSFSPQTHALWVASFGAEIAATMMQASPTQDAAAAAEASPTQDAAVVVEATSAPAENFDWGAVRITGLNLPQVEVATPPATPPIKKPRIDTSSASSAPSENFDLPQVAVAPPATPPAADGPGGALDEAALDALRDWYVHKFNAPNSPKTFEIAATAKGEVVRCSLDWGVCSDEFARRFRSGSHSLGDPQPVEIATHGSEKILQLPRVYTQHHIPTAGADPRSLCELSEWRGKAWRLAHFKYTADAPYVGEAAEAYVKELVAACYPQDVLVTLSGDACAAMVLVRQVDRMSKNVELSAHCLDVKWLYSKAIARGAALMTLARQVQQCGRTFGGTLLVTDVPHTDRVGLAPEFNMKQLHEYFSAFTREQFNLFVGDAKLRRTAMYETSLDKAVLTVHPELKSYVSDMNEATSTIQKVEGDAHEYEFKDFLPSAYSLKGSFWDNVTNTIGEQSLDDWLSKDTRHNYLATTLIMVGVSGVGKSELANVMARELSRKHGFTKFVSCKLLDSIGRLTLAGHTDHVGAFHFTDFELRTKLDRTPLSQEEVKGLLGPTEAGGFECRYHPAILPKYRPRIWTVNSGGDKNKVDFEDWFRKQQHTEALQALCRKDGDWLLKANAHDQAVARRAFIVHVTDLLFAVLPPGEDFTGASSYFQQASALPPRC